LTRRPSPSYTRRGENWHVPTRLRRELGVSLRAATPRPAFANQAAHRAGRHDPPSTYHPRPAADLIRDFPKNQVSFRICVRQRKCACEAKCWRWRPEGRRPAHGEGGSGHPSGKALASIQWVTRRPVRVIQTGPSSDGCTCSARNRLRDIIGLRRRRPSGRLSAGRGGRDPHGGIMLGTVRIGAAVRPGRIVITYTRESR